MSSGVASEKRGDVVYTPKWCAEDMVNHFQPTGSVLEPCRGLGVFTDLQEDARRIIETGK